MCRRLLSLDQSQPTRVLGSGKRHFPEGGEQKAFKLVESKPFPSGVVVLTYEPVRD